MMEPDTIPAPPSIPWPEFVELFQWRQGEHVAMIGPTGSGKTNLAFWLLPLHKYITIVATKPRDSSLSAFGKRAGFKIIREWSRMSVTKYPRRILWPNAKTVDAAKLQQSVFDKAFRHIYVEGGWTLYIDELYFVCAVLGFTPMIKVYLLQARAMDISLVCATQRPAWVPLEVYDQSTHLFFWRDNDERNLKRLSGISWISARLIQHTIAHLPKYHVLYINTRTGDMMVTRPPAPRKEVGK